MEIVFLGDTSNKNSVIVSTNETTFLIDSSEEFLNMAERENINNIDFILISSPEMLEGIPKIKEWMDSKNINSVMAFMSVGTYAVLKDKYANIDFLEVRHFQPNVKFVVNNIAVTPVAIHNNDFENYGFSFLDMFYSNRAQEIIPETMENYDSNLVIFGAGNWFGVDSSSVSSMLKCAKDKKPRKLIFLRPEEQKDCMLSENQISQYWKEIGGEDIEMMVAQRGLRLLLREHISQILYEIKEGILVKDAESICSGNKKLIIESKLYKNKLGKFMYFVEGKLCYGILRLKTQNKINIQEFKETSAKHLISDEMREKWWPFKEVLYAYEFDVVETFEYPKPTVIKNIENIFIPELEFSLVETEDLIKDIKAYDPEKQPNDVLRDDWRIVNAWYSMKKSGNPIKHSIEDIINLAKIIYLELKKRGTNFHPETMQPNSRDLYDKVSRKSLSLKNPEILEEMDDKIVIKDFISVVGSCVEGKEYPNDIDLLVRLNNPTGFIQRAIETRILKNVSYADDLHFIWGDPEGPHDTFVPLYDLCLKRIQPVAVVRMQKEVIGINSDIFNPMKPSQRFYDIDEILNYMFKNQNKYAIEKKYNGFRGLLVKTGSSINLYSDQKKDISRNFKTIMMEAKNLTSKNYILDGELVFKSGGRAEIIKYIVGNEDIDDSAIEFHVFDCIDLDQDLSGEDWCARKSILHSLNFTNHIVEVHSIMVDSRGEAEKAIKLVRNLKGSEGAMIKRYEGKYKKNGETDDWIKFRNEDAIIVKVLDISVKDNGKTFLMGILEFPNANEKYVKDGYLVLGNTFVSEIPASIGDNIEVNIEEVWRHSFKDGTLRYSVHKPKAMAKSNAELSSWKDLDALAVSKGEEVVENVSGNTTSSTKGIEDISGKEFKRKKIEGPKIMEEVEIELAGEGGEIMVQNFPDRMQRAFRKVQESGESKSFVMQWHLRGNKSVHTDLRMDVGDILEGFTLFTPGSIVGEDKLNENPSNIRGTIKVPQPEEWLTVNKGLPAGGPGATTNTNAYFAIIAKGKYKINEITDHKIAFELQSDSGKTTKLKPLVPEDTDIVNNFNDMIPDSLKQLNGNFSYHIAHIEDASWIILFDKIKGE